MAIGVQRLDHVNVTVPAALEPAAKRFYGEVLGLTEIPKPEAMRARGGLWFHGGIHLGIEDGMRPSAKVHPALVVEDVEAVRRTLVAAGCEWRDADDLAGVRRGHTRDPFGNRIEITE